jgi:hypothetical protein
MTYEVTDSRFTCEDGVSWPGGDIMYHQMREGCYSSVRSARKRMVQCGVVEDRGLLGEVEELSHGYRVTRNPTKVECREVCQTFPRQGCKGSRNA